MDALTAIGVRRSVRKFLKKPVPVKVLEKIVDAARLAPTARNEQPWEFVVITDRERLQQVAGLTDHGRFIADAGACIDIWRQDLGL